jgi:AraC-like DNA-binding protein
MTPTLKSTPATVQDRPKGVVAPHQARKMFRMERYVPGAELVPHLDRFLDHFWIVEWDLGAQPPYVQRTLPYPCVHVVFDSARSGIWGVPTGAFDYELKGAGKVCGLRFRPGAFRAVLGRPLNSIADRVLALSEVFPWDGAAATREVLGCADDAAMIAAATRLLAPQLADPDPQVERIAAILRTVETTPGLTHVEQLAEQCGIGVRSLQQLFGDYVGVSPKWVIRRFRIHEAADRLANGVEPDLAALAQELGYFDQAHFSADFRKLVGESPAHYRQRARQP